MTINNEKNEKIIRFKIKLKLPFLSSFSFLMYLEKSPNDKITIEKKVNVVPATVIMGPTLLALNIF